MFYCNRSHAGEEIAVALRGRTFERPVVLGITGSGIEVAIPVARSLRATLGFLGATRLRAPWNPEVAIGAVTADGLTYVNERAARGVEGAYLAAEKTKQLSLARQREKRLGASREPLRGRDVILVEAGAGTGFVASAAMRSCLAAGARSVILALPVALPEALARLRLEAGEVMCLREDAHLFAVGEAYWDYPPIDDAEVEQILRSYRRPGESIPAPRPGSSPPPPFFGSALSSWGVPGRASIDWLSPPSVPPDSDGAPASRS